MNVMLGVCRLLQKLVDAQMAFQDVLKLAIDDKHQQTDLLRLTIRSYTSYSTLRYVKNCLEHLA